MPIDRCYSGTGRGSSSGSSSGGRSNSSNKPTKTNVLLKMNVVDLNMAV
jgi:hypothetical protein